MASRLAYLTALGCTALLMGACIIKSTTTDDDTHTTTTTTTTPTGEGGSGGSVVTGGSGGTGGQISTGGSGGVSCVDATGSGVTAAACDEMNITPVAHGGQAMGCGPNYDEDGPGYVVCVRGFEIYTAGQAEDLQACLALIGVEDTCDEAVATACVEQMYNDACPRQDIVDACAGIQTQCGADPFDAEQCAADLNPFSDAGLDEMTACINSQPVEMSCQDAYDACIQTVASA
jgi:hypothetical protein